MDQQQFRVVQCCECLLYQNKQVSKQKTFVCTVCHKRQSIKKIVMQGSTGDCRRLVQKLNLEQHEKDHEELERDFYERYYYGGYRNRENFLDDDFDENATIQGNPTTWMGQCETASTSKQSEVATGTTTSSQWSQFLKPSNGGSSTAQRGYEQLNEQQPSAADSCPKSRDKFAAPTGHRGQ